jgi:hypothetical protein
MNTFKMKKLNERKMLNFSKQDFANMQILPGQISDNLVTHITVISQQPGTSKRPLVAIRNSEKLFFFSLKKP